MATAERSNILILPMATRTEAMAALHLRTIEALARAGIPVGVSVSPVIPFLNEPELERILQAARNAGASRALQH